MITNFKTINTNLYDRHFSLHVGDKIWVGVHTESCNWYKVEGNDKSVHISFSGSPSSDEI